MLSPHVNPYYYFLLFYFEKFIKTWVKNRVATHIILSSNTLILYFLSLHSLESSTNFFTFFRFYFDYYYFFFFLYLYLFREGVITILNKLFLSLSLIFFSLWIFFCKFIDIKMTRKKVKIYEMSIIIQIASKTHFLEVFVL